MSDPLVLTAIGSVLVSLAVGVVLPVLFKRQNARQAKELEERTARQLKEQQEREEIKENAKRDASTAANEVVSWEKINQALAARMTEEQAANRLRLVEQREQFTGELERLRRLTDDDMGRAKAEISRLSDLIRSLEERISQLTSRGAS